MTPLAAEKSKVNILIVDDKLGNICSVQAVLSNPEYNLVSATSGVEALKCMLLNDFAVILLDVMMPEMDGFEVARLVRQRGRTETIPIIFLTAIATEGRYMAEGYAAGAVDYLQKPLDPDMLRAKVSVFVELHRRNELIKAQEARLRELMAIEQERRLEDIRQESERHFRKLAESLPQIVLTADRVGHILYANPRWMELSSGAGQKVESFHDDAFLRIIHPDDQLSYLSLWKTALSSGEAMETELRFKDPATESFRWYVGNIQPELSQQNERVGWLATFADIDHQKRRAETQRLLADSSSLLAASQNYEHSLLQVAQRLAQTFADVCVIDVIKPRHGYRRLIAARTPYAALEATLKKPTHIREAEVYGAVGLAEAQAVRLSALGARQKDFHPELARHWQADELAGTSLISAPLHVRGTLSGSVTMFRCRTHERFNDEDLVVLVDLCRHMALTMENLFLYEEVSDNNRLKDEFLALLSHELRTPLNSILGWTELVKMEATETTVIEGLEVVERSAQALTQLVNDLLDVSRIISGKLEISRQAIDIAPFLSNVVSAIRPLAAAKKVQLQLNEEGDLPRIAADPNRLEQIIWNLLNNAIKFTPPEGEVTIAARVAAQHVAIEVKDSGVGIKPELMPYVFERFRQADSSSTRRHGGLGLGLAIVKHLAQLHEGTVTVASPGPGLGATFTVMLPFSRQMPSVSVLPPQEGEEAIEKELNDICVLLVDDDPSTRMLTAKQLSLSGASVLAASSVREAMEIVTGKLPDIVLTDIGMPEQDGFSLLHILRNLETQLNQTIRVAAFSAYASEDDARRALEEGFDAYLTKPISAAHLVQAVVRLKVGSPVVTSPQYRELPTET